MKAYIASNFLFISYMTGNASALLLEIIAGFNQEEIESENPDAWSIQPIEYSRDLKDVAWVKVQIHVNGIPAHHEILAQVCDYINMNS